MPLLGIVFVVSSSEGAQMVFRYPPVFRSMLSRETLESFKKIQANAEATYSGPLNKPVYSWPSVLLGPCKLWFDVAALAPHLDLCNREFELIIDDTLFIGRPTSYRPDRLTDSQKQAQEEEVPHTPRFPPHLEQKAHSTFRMFNVAFALDSTHPPSELRSYHRLARDIATAILHEQERSLLASFDLLLLPHWP